MTFSANFPCRLQGALTSSTVESELHSRLGATVLIVARLHIILMWGNIRDAGSRYVERNPGHCNSRRPNLVGVLFCDRRGTHCPITLACLSSRLRKIVVSERGLSGEGRRHPEFGSHAADCAIHCSFSSFTREDRPYLPCLW